MVAMSSPPASNAVEPFDIVVVGAGLTGIGAAVWFKKARPSKSIAILEARDAIGGTWDQFRYPGVRSDSDMFTLAYGFSPWTGPASIVDGSVIRDYIKRAAEVNDGDCCTDR